MNIRALTSGKCGGLSGGWAFRISNRDTLGLATSWGSPPELALRDQVTTELFYRLQVTQNLSLTPNLQELAKDVNGNKDRNYER